MAYEGQNVGFYLEEIDGVYTALPINRNRLNKNDKNQTQDEPQGSVNEAGFFSSTNSAAVGNGTTSVILNDGGVAPPPGTNDFGDSN